MNLLVVDTSTTSCSVALFRDDRLIAETVYTAGTTHSRHLMSMIHNQLEMVGWMGSDIDGIAVTRGPGTFTGLRIGISTVKGLAAALQVPVVGVSSLAALAYPYLLCHAPVVAIIDARRGEIYHARYEGTSQPVSPVRVDAPQTVAQRLPEDAILVGSGAMLYRIVFEEMGPRIRFADASAHVIRAASVGRLAMHRFRRQDVDRLDDFTPDYIRQSDAQVHSG